MIRAIRAGELGDKRRQSMNSLIANTYNTSGSLVSAAETGLNGLQVLSSLSINFIVSVSFSGI